MSKGGRVQGVAIGGVAVAAMAEEEEGTDVPMLTLGLVTTTKVSSVHNRSRPLCVGTTDLVMSGTTS